jgi:hypothetical protein
MIEAAVVAFVLVDCVWLSAAAVAAAGFVDALLAELEAAPLSGSAALAVPDPAVVPLVVDMLDNVWLIEMS